MNIFHFWKRPACCLLPALSLVVGTSLFAQEARTNPLDRMNPEQQKQFLSIVGNAKRPAIENQKPLHRTPHTRAAALGNYWVSATPNTITGQVNMEVGGSWEDLNKVQSVTFSWDGGGSCTSYGTGTSIWFWEIGEGYKRIDAIVSLNGGGTVTAGSVWVQMPYDCCAPTAQAPVVTFDSDYLYVDAWAGDDLGLAGISVLMDGSQIVNSGGGHVVAAVPRTSVAQGGALVFRTTAFDFYGKVGQSGETIINVPPLPPKPVFTRLSGTARSTGQSGSYEYRINVAGVVQNANSVELYIDGVFVKTVTPRSDGGFNAFGYASYSDRYEVDVVARNAEGGMSTSSITVMPPVDLR